MSLADLRREAGFASAALRYASRDLLEAAIDARDTLRAAAVEHPELEPLLASLDHAAETRAASRLADNSVIAAEMAPFARD